MAERQNSKQEKARVERCCSCGSTRMKNNVFFPRGTDVKIYVQCADCGEFVARYIISGYTSDKHFESFLRSLRFNCHSSGKKTMRTFKAFADQFEGEYQHVLELISEREDQRPIQEIIEEEYEEPDS